MVADEFILTGKMKDEYKLSASPGRSQQPSWEMFIVSLSEADP